MSATFYPWSGLAPAVMWIPWKAETRANGKTTKVPYSVRGGFSSTLAPGTWSTLQEVKAYSDKSGVGIQLIGLEDDTNLCGIDFDSALHSDGTVEKWAQRIIDLLKTYTEVSPSGTGFKAFFRLRYHDWSRIYDKLDGFGAGWPQMTNGHGQAGEHPPSIVLDLGRRYYTVTGKIIDAAPKEIRLLDEIEIDAILNILGPRPKQSGGANDADPGDVQLIDEDEVKAKLLAAMAADPRLDRICKGDWDAKPGRIDRSARALTTLGILKGNGFDFSESVAILKYLPGQIKEWMAEKGHLFGYREVNRAWQLAKSNPPPIPAQDEFEADLNAAPPDEPIVEPDDRPAMVPVANIPNSETSDAGVAYHICYNDGYKLSQKLAFVPESNRWIVWKTNGWYEDSQSLHRTSFLVHVSLMQYAAQFGTNWNRGLTEKMLSNSKVKSVTETMTRLMAKEADSIKPPRMYHLQTPEYTVDLRTGKRLTMSDRKRQYDTRYTTVTPSIDLTPTPLFDNVIFNLCNGNNETVEWLWHYLGYCMLGDPREDCFVIVWGPGGNGKSVLIDILQHIFGDYVVPLDNRVLLERGQRLHDTSLYQLKNKRLALVSEMSHKDKWNEPLLKQITGGDKVNARKMRSDAETFTSEASLLVVCNELPSLSQVTQAVLRRFRIIGTTTQPEVPDTSLREKIRQQEAPSILAKIIHYASKVYNATAPLAERCKLPQVPAVMVAEANMLLAENDNTFGWLADECDYGKPDVMGCYEELAMLKERFELWLTRHNKGGGLAGDSVSEKAFKQSLQRLGVNTRGDGGEAIRRNVMKGGKMTKVPVAMGIRLKVKAVGDV